MSRERFENSWTSLDAQGDPAPVYEGLVHRHAAEGRHYHTLAHVVFALHELEHAHDELESPAEAAMALWFHDAIYDPRATDNEQRSADLAREQLGAALVDTDAIARIAAHILATKHDVAQDAGDARFVVDADLAILGAAPNLFDRYEAQVRREYAFVPNDMFCEGRARLLQQFLARDSVFLTDVFRSRYEAAAQENLRRSLAALDAE